MTRQEDKQLLLKDLCTRLPYGVKGLYQWKSNKPFDRELTGVLYDEVFSSLNSTGDSAFSPYLRPMESMTEEEKEEFRSLSDNIQVEYGKGYGYFFLHCIRLGILPGNPHECIDDFIDMSAIDWLNAHHFDYRGLIDDGLALEAPNDMYKIE